MGYKNETLFAFVVLGLISIPVVGALLHFQDVVFGRHTDFVPLRALFS